MMWVQIQSCQDGLLMVKLLHFNIVIWGGGGTNDNHIWRFAAIINFYYFGNDIVVQNYGCEVAA